MTLNSAVRKLHYWASICIALPALVLIVSGLLLQTKKHWSWVQPAEQRASSTTPQITLDDLVARLAAEPRFEVGGWDDVRRIDFRPSRGVAKVWLASGWEVQMDLDSGRILQHAYRRSDLIESIHDGSFFAGEWTKLGLFLPTGLVLLFLWGSGMFLFWLPFAAKRRRAKEKLRTGARVTP